MRIVSQSASLLSMTPDPLLLIERCGRVCYGSADKMQCDCQESDDVCPSCIKRATTFVKGLIRREHLSVLEHASATFLLVTDRGVSHELVRHRIAAYSQVSTRYCDSGKGGEISVILPSFFADADSFQTWVDACEQSEKAYINMTKCATPKVPPQWARAVLPTCLKTEIAATMNFREWRHVLKLRLAEDAHPQIRDLASLVLDELLKTSAEPVFADLKKDQP